MRRNLLVWTTALLLLPPVGSSGAESGKHVVLEGAMTISLSAVSEDFDGRPSSHTYAPQGLSGTVAVTWKLWTLMGEPVLECKAALALRSGPKVSAWDAGNGRHLPQQPIPAEVLERLRLRELVVDIPVSYSAYRGVLRCDVGAPGDTYGGSISSLRQLSKEAQRPYFSFNSPGSPAWSKLVRSSIRMSQDDIFWSDELVRESVRSKTLRDGSPVEIAKARWDLTPLWRWRAELLRGVVAEVKTEADEPPSTSKGVERPTGSFWDTPETVETVAEERTRQTRGAEAAQELAKGEEVLAETQKSADLALREIEAKRAGAAKWEPKGSRRVRAEGGAYRGQEFFVAERGKEIECALVAAVLDDAPNPRSDDCIGLLCGPGHAALNMNLTDPCVPCSGVDECVRRSCGDQPRDPSDEIRLEAEEAAAADSVYGTRHWARAAKHAEELRRRYGAELPSWTSCADRARPICAARGEECR